MDSTPPSGFRGQTVALKQLVLSLKEFKLEKIAQLSAILLLLLFHDANRTGSEAAHWELSQLSRLQ